MPTYQDLLAARIAGTARREVAVPICLDPVLLQERARLAANPPRATGTGKLAGKTASGLDSQIEDATLVAVFATPDPVKQVEAEARNMKAGDAFNYAAQARETLVECWVRCEKLDGTPVEVTGAQFEQLVINLTHGELVAAYTAVIAASSDMPDFPTISKRSKPTPS